MMGLSPEPVVKTVPAAASAAFFVVGVFFLGGAALHWQWLLQGPPARSFADVFGEGPPRLLYCALGVLLIAFAGLIAAGFGTVEAIEWFLTRQLMDR